MFSHKEFPLVTLLAFRDLGAWGMLLKLHEPLQGQRAELGLEGKLSCLRTLPISY